MAWRLGVRARKEQRRNWNILMRQKIKEVPPNFLLLSKVNTLSEHRNQVNTLSEHRSLIKNASSDKIWII